MFVIEIRVRVRKREFCVCERERETVVGKGTGSRSCVCVCERERGDGSRGCLIGKQMNNVSLGWRQKGDRNKCCVYMREIESNFSCRDI